MKKSRQSMVFQFFFSYILCVLFPLVIFVSVILLYSQTTMKSNTLGAYASIQQGNVQDIEQVFRHAHSTAFRMAYENAVYKLNASSYEQDRVELNFLVQKVISSLRISSSQIYQTDDAEVALYFERSDTVATPSTKYDYRLYMERILSVEGAQAQAQYISDRFSADGVRYLLFPAQGGERLIYVVPLEMFGSDTHTYLIAAIPFQSILSRGMEGFPQIVHREGEVLAGYGVDANGLPADFRQWRAFGRKVRLGADTYYQVTTASSALGLSCTALVRTDAIWRQLHTVYLILALLAVTTLSLGAAFSWFLSKHSLQPIKGILRALEPYRDGETDEAFQNEAIQINETIGRLVANNTQLQGQVSEQLSVLQNAFLYRLLMDPFPMRGYEEKLALYGIRFPHPAFGVIIARVEQSADFASDVLKTLLATILSEQYAHHCIYTVSDTSNALSIIVNFDGTGTLEEIARSLRRMLPTYMLMGCSRPAPDLSQLHAAYAQAAEAMADGFLDGTLLSFYGEINPRESFLDFPSDREISLSNCIKEKDAEKAKALIRAVIEKNQARNRGSSALLGVLYYDLLSALLKTASETGLSPGRLWGAQEAERFSSAPPEVCAGMLESLCRRICESLTVPETNHASALKARLLDFIHENYHRSDLSLNLIARNFNISPQYLSSFFKSQVGKNYVDYVTQYRLHKSIALLADSSLPIRRIAEQVGYTDAGNYIRVFKKYYSVTPGQYRDSGRA